MHAKVTKLNKTAVHKDNSLSYTGKLFSINNLKILMPDEKDRIIAEDAFNKRLSGVRKGRPTTEANTSFMGKRPNKPNVEAMLGIAGQQEMPIVKEDNDGQPPLSPDIQEQLKALAQMPQKQAPEPRRAPPIPPDAPQNPLKPAVDGKPELLGQFDDEPRGHLPAQPQALAQQRPQQAQMQAQAQVQAPPRTAPVPPPPPPASQRQNQNQNTDNGGILSPARAEQQDKIEKTYFFDHQISTIYNFRHSMRTLEREVKRAARHERPLSVCILTFHEMNIIKNNFGELALEESLQNLGKVLRHYVDLDMEVAGRYGENQIVVVLPEITAPVAAQLMDEIRRTLENSIVQLRQYKFSLVASIGIAGFPTHGTNWKELLVKAEQASEQAIERGGNTIAFPPRL